MGWSFVESHGGFVDSTYTCAADAVPNEPINLCAGEATRTLTSDLALHPGPIYYLSCQLFIADGATLVIGAGVTIYAIPSTATGVAPVVVVERGGHIIADGTAPAPITFTALNPEVESSSTVTSDTSADDTTTLLETRGKWGGVILLGNAPTSDATDKEIEGITGHFYGGSDPADSSGVLRYVRVWHGGAAVSPDNEINGITFGGVGSSTVVEYCEVAFNADDGFEFVSAPASNLHPRPPRACMHVQAPCC